MPWGPWFRYEDRNVAPYNPLAAAMITTHRYWHEHSGDPASSTWVAQDWHIRSALVNLEQLHRAAASVTGHELDFGPWWRTANDFDFGEHARVHDDIDIFPWIFQRRDLHTRALVVDLRQDFVRYHSLQERTQGRLFHPVDDALVLEITVDAHTVTDTTPRILVHTNYLRDFLAASGMGMLISVVADRFATAVREEELELPRPGETAVDRLTWLKTTLHTPDDTGGPFYRGRSTLIRNLVVEPLDRPIVERSPWPYYDALPSLDSQASPPLFLLDTEGNRGSLTDPNCPLYLYFQPEVLRKYLNSSGYRVFFHMRNWGSAVAPGPLAHGVDVGINSQGIVTAFAPDLARLRPTDQAYWAGFSTLPNGEVCDELFQTRMMNDPPDSPGVVEFVEDTIAGLNAAFRGRFSVDLYGDYRPNQRDLSYLSVGPLSRTDETLRLAAILYGWVIENMRVEGLRTALQGRVTFDEAWRQIKLLERVLSLTGIPESQLKEFGRPLRCLNELRQEDAHIGSSRMIEVFRRMGVGTDLPARRAWNGCVDAITKSLRTAAAVVQQQ